MRTLQTPHSQHRLGFVCVGISLAFLALWFVGQEASSDPTLQVPALLERLYPGTWHPFARGVLWLFTGATAVWLDLAVMAPRAASAAGRRAAVALAIVSGASFAAFAVGSFIAAPWSVIH